MQISGTVQRNIIFGGGCGNQSGELATSRETIDTAQTKVKNVAETQDNLQKETSEGTGNIISISQTGITQLVPDEYLEPAGL